MGFVLTQYRMFRPKFPRCVVWSTFFGGFHEGAGWTEGYIFRTLWWSKITVSIKKIYYSHYYTMLFILLIYDKISSHSDRFILDGNYSLCYHWSRWDLSIMEWQLLLFFTLVQMGHGLDSSVGGQPLSSCLIPLAWTTHLACITCIILPVFVCVHENTVNLASKELLENFSFI